MTTPQNGHRTRRVTTPPPCYTGSSPSGTTPPPANVAPVITPSGSGPMGGRRRQARTGGRTQQGSQPRRSSATGSPRAANAPSRRGSRYTPPDRIRQAHVPAGNYQPVILAEFIAVILVLALAPVARTASSSSSSSSSFSSPYAGSDMVKLAAATLLFVIFGFMSSAGHGAARMAAWLGGLVAIAVGLAEGATVATELELFSGGLEKAATATGNVIGPSSSTSTTAATTSTPATTTAPPATQPNASGTPIRQPGVHIT